MTESSSSDDGFESYDEEKTNLKIEKRIEQLSEDFNSQFGKGYHTKPFPNYSDSKCFLEIYGEDMMKFVHQYVVNLFKNPKDIFGNSSTISSIEHCIVITQSCLYFLGKNQYDSLSDKSLLNKINHYGENLIKNMINKENIFYYSGGSYRQERTYIVGEYIKSYFEKCNISWITNGYSSFNNPYDVITFKKK